MELVEPVPMNIYLQAKSISKTKLKVEVSAREIPAEAVFIDGGEILHSAVY